MKINSISTSIVKVNTYYITLKDGRNVVYIEHVNEKDRVDDFFLRDEDGNDMGDEAAGIVDHIDAAIEALPKEQ